jgi:haloalkane dehalogenase
VFRKVTQKMFAEKRSVVEEETVSRPEWLDEKEYPFASHFVEIEGNRIHYIDVGQGPTLVFLHNVGLWSYEFRQVVKELRGEFRCIALDYPGFGLSEARGDFRNSIRTDSQIVLKFLDKLSLTQVTLVCSEGSVPIGVAVAEQDPESITGLVLSGGFAWPLEDRAFGKDHMSNFFSKFIASRTARFLIIQFNFLNFYTMNFFPEKGKLSAADKRAYSVPFASRSKRRHQADLIAVGRSDPSILAEIERRSPELSHLPVLLLPGEFDPTRLAGWDKQLVGMFPCHTLDIVKGAAHFPTAYSPEYFASAISNWWKDKARLN